MALTLLRHASLSKEHQNRYNGWSNLEIDPLLFDYEKIESIKKQKFDTIYSSDLLRCQQTLNMIGITDYIADKRLREVRFTKEIEGLSFDEIEKLDSYKIEYTKNIDIWYNYICAEPQEHFNSRIKEFLDELPKDKEILICSHGGTLRTMMSILGYTKDKIDYLENIRIENVIQ